MIASASVSGIEHQAIRALAGLTPDYHKNSPALALAIPSGEGEGETMNSKQETSRFQSRLLHLLIAASPLAVLATLPACNKQFTPTHSAPEPTTSGTEDVVHDRSMRYVQCDEKIADTMLKVKVTIRNFADQEFTFPLKKERVYDDKGLLLMPASGPSGIIVCADGVKNG